MSWPSKVRGFGVLLAAWTVWAAADVGAQQPSMPSADDVGCEMRGTVTMPATVTIHAVAEQQSPIGRFTGSPSPVVFVPAPPGTNRLGVRTGTGRGSFRLDGYVAESEVPLVTTTQIPVVEGHLWIVSGQDVRVVGAERNRLKIEKQLTRPIDQTFAAWAPCGTVGLGSSTAPETHVAGNALGYVVKRPALELFDHWGAHQKLVTVLRRSSVGSGILLFSTERRGSWVRVEYSGAIGIDAWARARDLEALPPGEIMDNPPTTTLHSRRALRLARSGRQIRSTDEVPIRLEPRADAPVVGAIEPDTDTIVVHEAAAVWVSVLPKSMNVAPPGDGNFWVLRAELEGPPRSEPRRARR